MPQSKTTHRRDTWSDLLSQGRWPLVNTFFIWRTGRRIYFASWDAAPGTTTERTIFFVPLVPVRK